MRRILITGANSYIGTSFEKYIIDNYPNDYSIDTLDMLDPNWKEYDFTPYDVVFHVAGIAHADVGNVSEEVKKKYYQINTDLTIETATIAKASGVNQFIYMSSIIVYGESAPVGKQKIIDKNTIPQPANFYGDSKLQADIGLQSLNDNQFKVCILRPPMIYGPHSKGNYPLLAKLAMKLPIFPNIKNQRSMLYVDNLCTFIKYCIDKNLTGIYFPQNNEYVSTSNMVKQIAQVHDKKIHLTRLLNPLVYLASHIPGKIGKLTNKAFGNISYAELPKIQLIQLSESIKETEINNV